MRSSLQIHALGRIRSNGVSHLISCLYFYANNRTAFLEQQEEQAGGQPEDEEGEGDTSEHAGALEAVALHAVQDDDEEEAALERSTEPETGADD